MGRLWPVLGGLLGPSVRSVRDQGASGVPRHWAGDLPARLLLSFSFPPRFGASAGGEHGREPWWWLWPGHHTARGGRSCSSTLRGGHWPSAPSAPARGSHWPRGGQHPRGLSRFSGAARGGLGSDRLGRGGAARWRSWPHWAPGGRGLRWGPHPFRARLQLIWSLCGEMFAKQITRVNRTGEDAPHLLDCAPRPSRPSRRH